MLISGRRQELASVANRWASLRCFSRRNVESKLLPITTQDCQSRVRNALNGAPVIVRSRPPKHVRIGQQIPNCDLTKLLVPLPECDQHQVRLVICSSDRLWRHTSWTGCQLRVAVLGESVHRRESRIQSQRPAMTRAVCASSYNEYFSYFAVHSKSLGWDQGGMRPV